MNEPSCNFKILLSITDSCISWKCNLIGEKGAYPYNLNSKDTHYNPTTYFKRIQKEVTYRCYCSPTSGPNGTHISLFTKGK